MANEVRLIDANALKKAMRMWPRTKQPVLIYTGTILKGIEEAPTIDPESLRPKGRWEDEHGGKYANPRYRCSVCKEKALYKFERDILDNWKEVQALTPSCPNCGADMREG